MQLMMLESRIFLGLANNCECEIDLGRGPGRSPKLFRFVATMWEVLGLWFI
jgi:hypothetical protein